MVIVMRGFTFLEVLIVLSLVGILVAVALPAYRDSTLRAKEAVLRQDLYRMREALDEYYADQRAYPQMLSDLVDKGYLREIPVDPITSASDTWQVEYVGFGQIDPGEVAGIWDVHSGAQGDAVDGTPYTGW